MIILIATLIMILMALIGGVTAGLLQTSRLLSVIFYVLASAAAVKYLLTAPRKRQKERRKPNFPPVLQDEEAVSLPSPAPCEPDFTPDFTEETAEIIGKINNLVRRTAAGPPAPGTQEDGLLSRVPESAGPRELGAYEVVAAGFARTQGHELTLRPKKDGIFLGKEYNGIVYISLPDYFEGVGPNLTRHGIQQIFTLRDEQDRVLQSFPCGRLRISVAQEAVCRFYDGDQLLALQRKGTLYVISK